jgi:hypothetical protein
MAYDMPLTAQLVADLFLAIDQEDAAATFAAARALAARIGEPAALALARGLLADRRWVDRGEGAPLRLEGPPFTIACA